MQPTYRHMTSTPGEAEHQQQSCGSHARSGHIPKGLVGEVLADIHIQGEIIYTPPPPPIFG